MTAGRWFQPLSLQQKLLRIQLVMILLFLLGAALFGWRMTVLDQTIERHLDISERLHLLHNLEAVTPGGDLTAFARSDIPTMIRALEERASATEKDYRSQMVWVASTWTVVLLMPLALAFWPLRFSRSVIEGIRQLGRKLELGHAGRDSAAVVLEREDEIAGLGREIDAMFAHLRRRETEASLSRQLRLEQRKLTDVISLVGGIAHEVANPLSVILANLDSLDSGGDFPETEKIREGLKRIQDLLRDVTAFSVGEDEVGLVNINEVAASAFRVVRLDDRLRSNTLEVELDPQIPAVSFSPTVMTLATFSLMSLGAAMLGGGKGGMRISSGSDRDAVELQIQVRGEPGGPCEAALADGALHPTVEALSRVVRGYGGDLLLPRIGEFKLRFPLIVPADGGLAHA